MSKNIFIGGAWPYANNSLHIGHLAALLPGDVLARFFRLNGDNVTYVSGTDSHGTPITVRAKKEGVDPSVIASMYHEEFLRTFENLDFSYDIYSATTTDHHKSHVKEYLKRIKNNGYLYEKLEEQDYCQNCKIFLSDREIIGVCPHCGGKAKGDQCDECNAILSPKEVLNKTCSICGTPTQQKENKHMYFALSKFQNEIREFIDNHKDTWRVNAVNESLKFLDQGLIDRAATRQLEWGIDVPFEGFEDKKIYVWIEAVLGYLSTLEYTLEQKGQTLDEYLKSQDTVSYYVHGKDNIPFHTIIFPALLMSLDKKYNLPDVIVSSEYVNMNNQKMSKSMGNLISANNLNALFGKDSVRFNIIYNGPEVKDVNFSLDQFIQDHNKYLVGVIGNFVNRNLSFVNREFEGKIPNGEVDPEIVALTREHFEEIGQLIKEAKLKAALTKAINYASEGNKYYDTKQPWKQVKEDIVGFNNTTYTCVYMMANMAVMFEPFIPGLSQKIREKLNLPKVETWGETQIGKDLVVANNDVFYPRYKLDEVEKQYLELLKK